MTAGRLTPRGRSLRQRGGMVEDRVWARLRGGAVDGWKVRRQHPVGPHVVDFACMPLRLVIEIDGGVHGRDDVVVRDHIRQEAIEALGWTMVRFTNDQALAEPWRIDAAIREQAKALGFDPSPDGRGLEARRAERCASRKGEGRRLKSA